MELLLAAIEAHKAGIVNRRTVRQLAHNVLIDAANSVGLPNATAMILLLAKATDVQDEIETGE